MMKAKMSLLAMVFCLVFQNINALCIYIAPTSEKVSPCFLENLRESAKESEFHQVQTLIEAHKSSQHQFAFFYPLTDEAQAETFRKILLIKSQEAHRFVPVMESCHFIKSTPSGFIREFTIREGGPKIQERVLIDKTNRSVIFIEESILLGDDSFPGQFAALNKIEEIDGLWGFAGIYLYAGPKPSEKEISERIAMFDLTFDHMRRFANEGNVDVVLNQLQAF